MLENIVENWSGKEVAKECKNLETQVIFNLFQTWNIYMLFVIVLFAKEKADIIKFIVGRCFQ